jgi:hypothetical protein
VSRKLLGALVLLPLMSIPASADSLIFTLDQSTLYSPPGGISLPELCTNADGSGNCVIFTGTISTNDPSQDYFPDALYLTMDSSNPDGGGVNVLDNTPLNNVPLGDPNGNAFFLSASGPPGILGPDNPGGNTYSGGIFEVDVLAAAAAGAYSGTATIDFTDEANCQEACTAFVPFTVVVTPEPDTLALGITGLAAFAIMRRRSASNAR